ncbi:peroxisomal membrane protein 11C [Ooceraea biroi]|nr:peroxisomal membrane protein 11C [Ooceraea biroi]
MSENNAEIFTLYLRTLHGRNQVLNIVANLPKLLTISAPLNNTRKHLNIFKSQITYCISIENLLDVISLFSWIRSSGWGSKEPDHFIRCCNVIINAMMVFNQAISHIIWADKHNILTINVDKWNPVAACFAIGTSNIDFLRSFRRIKVIREIHKLKQDENNNYKLLISRRKRHYTFCERKIDQQAEKKKVNYLIVNEAMTCMRVTLQTICFINYLPNGILWGGRLMKWQLGALGIISSLIHSYQFYKFNSIVNYDDYTSHTRKLNTK